MIVAAGKAAFWHDEYRLERNLPQTINSISYIHRNKFIFNIYNKIIATLTVLKIVTDR